MISWQPIRRSRSYTLYFILAGLAWCVLMYLWVGR